MQNNQEYPVVRVPLFKGMQGLPGMSDAIFGVQPIANYTPKVYTLNISDEPRVPEEGDIIHSFLYGWQIFRNGEYRSE